MTPAKLDALIRGAMPTRQGATEGSVTDAIAFGSGKMAS